ncbi:PREDICTED: BBSome-interacting protein 1 [Ceratosolen solmsi marchali]|uniref:BBSome-interacting protein 1 n=1 Tax=Ceratosolen solmsi marchali TaxID=326594 RepID=A0AAJ6VLH4_9HYME|nr:PREDICTED: BBSome-interacting protein 1 [Ceratosolen solmsi marchali]
MKMSESSEQSNFNVDIVIPQQGMLYKEDTPDYILCKPKLMPLKSVTLEKLEKMQKDAELKMKELENTTENKTSEH